MPRAAGWSAATLCIGTQLPFFAIRPDGGYRSRSGSWRFIANHFAGTDLGGPAEIDTLRRAPVPGKDVEVRVRRYLAQTATPRVRRRGAQGLLAAQSARR